MAMTLTAVFYAVFLEAKISASTIGGKRTPIILSNISRFIRARASRCRTLRGSTSLILRESWHASVDEMVANAQKNLICFDAIERRTNGRLPSYTMANSERCGLRCWHCLLRAHRLG